MDRGNDTENKYTVPDRRAAPINADPCTAYQLATVANQRAGPRRGVNPMHISVSPCRDDTRQRKAKQRFIVRPVVNRLSVDMVRIR